jgi:hypothetical protein
MSELFTEDHHFAAVFRVAPTLNALTQLQTEP